MNTHTVETFKGHKAQKAGNTMKNPSAISRAASWLKRKFFTIKVKTVTAAKAVAKTTAKVAKVVAKKVKAAAIYTRNNARPMVRATRLAARVVGIFVLPGALAVWALAAPIPALITGGALALLVTAHTMLSTRHDGVSVFVTKVLDVLGSAVPYIVEAFGFAVVGLMVGVGSMVTKIVYLALFVSESVLIFARGQKQEAGEDDAFVPFVPGYTNLSVRRGPHTAPSHT